MDNTMEVIKLGTYPPFVPDQEDNRYSSQSHWRSQYSRDSYHSYRITEPYRQPKSSRLNKHKSMSTNGSSSWESPVQPHASSDDSSGVASDSTTRKRSTQEISATSDKKRKTTYDIRREQKEALTSQVDKLQKQLDDLKYRVLVEQGEAAKSNERTAAGNAVLQEIIQQQHLELANLQAMLAGHLQQNVGSLHPAQTFIRLGKDLAKRHNTLMELKDNKLQEAKRFVTARSQGMDPYAAYFQEERNNSPGEDFCHVIFENRPIHGATAREVFDAFIDVAQNAEIVVSELFGSVSIREDNETAPRDNISQIRMVTSTSQGTMVESNTAMFAEFTEADNGSGENCGIIVADYVDSDELYPYKPDERARRDTTTVFMIRTFRQNSGDKPKENSNSADGKQLAVVVTRWTCSTIRRSTMDLSADALRELQESTVSFGDTMKKAIEERLGNRSLYNPKKA